MDTRSELEAELKSQLQVSTNSSLFPASRLTSLIQNAEKRATTMYIWQALMRARKTSTTAKGTGDDECYYDYPSDFRTGTVFRVRIDEKEYDRKNYETFMDFRNNYPSSSEKIFSNFRRFIFISPDTSVGSSNMDIWGAIESPGLQDGTSETIFSNNAEEGNNAIVKLALATALKRINKRLAQAEEEEALLTLGKMNNDEWSQYQRDQRMDAPLFDVPDFFGGVDNSKLIGRFVGFSPRGF